jgi:hypothetical protein
MIGRSKPESYEKEKAMDEQTMDEQERLSRVSLNAIAKQYGVSASAVLREAKKHIPLLQEQERIENAGPRYTAQGRSIPAGTQIGLKEWQLKVIADAAEDVAWRSWHRAGRCRIVQAAR